MGQYFYYFGTNTIICISEEKKNVRRRRGITARIWCVLHTQALLFIKHRIYTSFRSKTGSCCTQFELLSEYRVINDKPYNTIGIHPFLV
ncbi:hypothetical protein QE152_g1405 [Popillia japonica]|uniref:Uncharacterized protein n=1 Tax=Popillia japonica TaxID=7064 RepID=A0AAW1N850_POPJA